MGYVLARSETWPGSSLQSIPMPCFSFRACWSGHRCWNKPRTHGIHIDSLGAARQRYGKRGRGGRSRLLDEVYELCGYERKYAIKVKRQTSDNWQQRAQARRFNRLFTGWRNAR